MFGTSCLIGVATRQLAVDSKPTVSRRNPIGWTLLTVYTSASVIGTPRIAATTGEYKDLSPMTGLREFVTSFAAHIAAEAARK